MPGSPIVVHAIHSNSTVTLLIKGLTTLACHTDQGMPMTDLVAKSAPIVLWSTLIIFNIAIAKLLQYTLSNIDLKEALREKSLPPPPRGGGAQLSGGAAPPPTPSDRSDDTSYSRVAGMIGAIVLACFIWAVGNIILYKAFANIDDVKSILSNITPFILSGASLFAPYAFNKLSSVFSR
jgi:hypothetical protein